MSLAKQYFDDWLVSFKQQGCSFFLEQQQQQKIKSQITHEGLFDY